MKRTFTLYDLEQRVYGAQSGNPTTGRQRGLRRVLKILQGGEGVGKGNRYEWIDPADFDSLATKQQIIRKSLDY